MHPIHASPSTFLPLSTAKLLLTQELPCLSLSVSCVCHRSSLHLSSQFLPLSLMALIPAGAAAGGPVCVSLSLCILPVIKQTLAQDSVHAEYGEGRLVNTPPVFYFLAAMVT